jgi:alkanesulfonate monooxygenase SsuD/methylene tetrahydromethanopterin reductase-like flavin-dependent oxidoreductase (luciferase family)
MAVARAFAGAGADGIEWHLLVQAVVVTNDRRGAAERLLTEHRDHAEAHGATDEPVLTLDEALKTPYLLIGTADEIAAQLLRSRDRWGFSYVTVHEPYMQAFGPLIERLRGR